MSPPKLVPGSKERSDFICLFFKISHVNSLFVEKSININKKYSLGDSRLTTRVYRSVKKRQKTRKKFTTHFFASFLYEPNDTMAGIQLEGRDIDNKANDWRSLSLLQKRQAVGQVCHSALITALEETRSVHRVQRARYRCKQKLCNAITFLFPTRAIRYRYRYSRCTIIRFGGRAPLDHKCICMKEPCRAGKSKLCIAQCCIARNEGIN